MKRFLFVFIVLFGAATYAQENGILDTYDREIIATCMVLEAGGEGPEGMRAVLNVILHRAKSDWSRMVPVIVKPGAFSCMSSLWNTEELDYSPLLSHAQSQSEPYTEAMNLISTMEQGLLTDNTSGATHYHADYVTPCWISNMRYLTTIGGHLFYVELSQQVALL
jgi:spore germination cell wall hydrolase CwlJ-like protein